MSEQQRPERSNRKASRPGGTEGGGTGAGGLKFGRGVFGWLLFIGLAVMLFMLLARNNQNYKDIILSELNHQLQKEQVQRLVIDGSEVTGTFVDEYDSAQS